MTKTQEDIMPTQETLIEVIYTCELCNQDNNDDLTKCTNCAKKCCADCLTNIDGDQYCEDCRNDSFNFCESCNVWFSNDEGTFIDDAMYCQSCVDCNFISCDDCQEFVNNNNTVSDGRTTLCQSCYESDYITCTSCDRITQSGNYSCCDHCDEYYCDSCLSDHGCNEEIDLDTHGSELASNGTRAITDYHPNVSWEFIRRDNDNTSDPFFGVELEIESGEGSGSLNNAAKIVGKELGGYVLCSHDGSLKHGFEIITTPHKRKAFRQHNFYSILKQISDVGCRSHDKETCGLHVHIERKGFLNTRFIYKGNSLTNADMYQWFFNTFRSEIQEFSRRTDDQISNYCQFRYGSWDRYNAVNLTENKTIEIRIWRGTLKHDSFLACIQFSLAVLDFLKCHSMVELLQTKLTTANNYYARCSLKQKFKEWLSRADEYQFLARYFEHKNLFGFTKQGKNNVRNSNKTEENNYIRENSVRDVSI